MCTFHFYLNVYFFIFIYLSIKVPTVNIWMSSVMAILV